MITFVQLSGSIPSVLGENGGARMVTSDTTTSLQYTGCTVQKGEFIKVISVITKCSQFAISMSLQVDKFTIKMGGRKRHVRVYTNETVPLH